MRHRVFKTAVRYFIPVLFFISFSSYSQVDLGNSIVDFYNKNLYAYNFVTTYYSSTSGIDITKGSLSGYKDKVIRYRLTLDTLIYPDHSEFMGADCVNNKNFKGCNYKSMTYTDLSHSDEQYDQSLGMYLPLHIFNTDTLKNMFEDKRRFSIRITSLGDYYYATITDSIQYDDGFVKSLKWEWKYKVSKLDYRIYSLKRIADFSVDNVLFHDLSETVYLYEKKTKDQILRYINSFTPFKPEIIDDSLDSQDTLSYFPDFILTDILDKPFSSTSISSRFVLAEFWYKGCLPCIKNIKKLDSIRSVFDKNFLEIVAINDSDELNENLKRFINKFNPKYTLLFEGQALKEKIGISAHPTTYIYDNKTNKVVFYKKGTSYTYAEEIISVLHNLK